MRAPVVALVALLLGGCTDPIGVAWKQRLPAPSVSTPLVTDSFIAVGHELGLSILETDGTPRCLFRTHREVISAPATDGKLIFFGSTNYIFYAVDSGCTEAWKFPTGDRIKSDPLVSDGRVYLSSYDGHVHALEAASGKAIWTFPPPLARELDLPEAERPTAKTRARKRAQPALPPVEEPAPEPPEVPNDVGDFSYSSPVLAGTMLFVGNLDRNMYVLDAKSGQMVARFRTDGPVTSTALVADGLVYFGSNDGFVYAIDVSNGRPRWKLKTQDWVNSSPRLQDGILYIGSNDRHVYAVDAGTGRVEWKHETSGPAVARPVVYKNLLIAAGGSGDGAVYALQREDGSLFWRYRTGGRIDSDPVVVGDTLYVSSADRYLYAFELRRTTAD
jgi:outer membrane protein assembly factor BamB